ncbi:MAG TPA: PilW family protein [Plasticicumulans sp.]|nr:PilW family protein [Plasticicumulans sp.]
MGELPDDHRLLNTRAPRCAAGGFTLVEMMLALALGLLIVAGALAVYAANRAVYQHQEAWARLQENARLAFELMARDGRQAGFMACLPVAAPLTNVLNSATTYEWLFEQPVDGFEASGVSWSPTLPSGFPAPYRGTDVLTLRGAQSSPQARVSAQASTSADVTLDNGSGFASGDFVLLAAADCSEGAIFQVSGVTAGAAPVASLAHAAGAGSPGNASADLGARYVGGLALKLTTYSYYVAAGSDGRPALYRRQGSATPVELIPGVDDLQVLYGLADGSNGDYASRYATAAVISADADNWQKIVGLRVTMTLESPDDGITDSAQAVTINGVSGSDRRLRRTFTATIAIRNRLP